MNTLAHLPQAYGEILRCGQDLCRLIQGTSCLKGPKLDAIDLLEVAIEADQSLWPLSFIVGVERNSDSFSLATWTSCQVVDVAN